MAFNVAQSFHRTGPIPIDDSQVLTKAEMLAYADGDMPDVYFAVCKDDGNLYIYNKANTADPETGKFRILQNGSNSSVKQIDVDLALDSISENPVQNKVITSAITTIQQALQNVRSVPTGGTAGQILTKQTDADGDATWGEDIGASLIEFGRKYGVQVDGTPIKQIIPEHVSTSGIVRTYRVPIGGVLTDVNSLINGIYNNFDVYATMPGYSELYVNGTTRNKTANGCDYDMNATDHWLVISNCTVNGNYIQFKAQSFADLFAQNEITSLRFVAKGSNTFGIAGTNVPYDIRNLTGMVLDDLKITGNSIPTDWGIASVGTLRLNRVEEGKALGTINLSGFGFESADNYAIFLLTQNGDSSAWGDAKYYMGPKSATSVSVYAYTPNNTQYVYASYVIVAKGYGNNTMQGGGGGGSVDAYTKSETDALLAEKATGYFERTDYPITLDTVGQPYYALARDVFTIEIENHKPYTYEFTSSDVFDLTTRYNETVGKTFTAINEDNETIWITMKGALPDNVQYVVGSTNPVVDLTNATVTLTKTTFLQQIDDMLIPRTSGEVFVFDVDSDQFTEDPENTGGKHYGMTIDSPTFDEIMDNLVAGKIVFVRMSFNGGNSYDFYQLSRESQQGIRGKAFDLEFPQGHIWFYDIYIKKRGLGTNTTTYFGVFSDKVVDGSGSSAVAAESDIFRIPVDYTVVVDTTETLYGQTLDPDEPKGHSASGTLTGDYTYAKIVEALNAGKSPVVMLSNFWAGATSTGITIPMQHYVPTTGDPMFIGYYGFKRTVSNASYSTEPVILTVKIYESEGTTKVDISDNSFPNLFERVKALETASPTTSVKQIDVDAVLSDISENPVQNKVVTSAITTVRQALQNVETALANKQDTLTAGNGVEILADGTINMTKNIVRQSTVLWEGSYNDVRSGAITLSADISEYDEICAMSNSGEGVGQVSRLGSIRFTNGVENTSSTAYMQWTVSFNGNTATIDGSKLGSNGNYQYTLKEPLTKILGIKYDVVNAGSGETPTIDAVLTKGDTTDRSINFNSIGNESNVVGGNGMYLSSPATEGLRQVNYNQHVLSAINNLAGTMMDIFKIDFDAEEVTMSDKIKSSFMAALNAQGAGDGTVDTAMSDSSENAVQNKVIKEYVDGSVGDLTALTTTDKSSAVAAINEIDFAVKGLGEPFRVKQWASNTLNVEIPYCTEDIANGDIPKMVYTIDSVEGSDYQIVGMLAYEVFDAASGGNRINCFPVCQFTGNGQKELSVRWACMGTTRKTAKRINAWVLLKHR